MKVTDVIRYRPPSRRHHIGVLLVSLFLLGGCNTFVDSEVWADDYDRSCNAPSECVVVTEGDTDRAMYLVLTTPALHTDV